MTKQSTYSAKVQDPGGSGGLNVGNDVKHANTSNNSSARLEARKKLEAYLDEKRLRSEIDDDLI